MIEKKKIFIFGLFAVGISPQVFNGWYNPPLMGHPTAFWAVDILTLAVLPAAVYVAGRGLRVFSDEEVGFHCRIDDRRGMAFLIAAAVVITLMVYYGYWFLMGLGSYADHLFLHRGHDDFVFDFSMAVDGKGLVKWVQVLYFSVTAGLVEEFYYRGLFKTLFPPGRTSMVLYVILSAAIFGLIHWEGGLVKVFATFGLGLLLAGSYLITRNLWPLVIGHFAADVFLFS